MKKSTSKKPSVLQKLVAVQQKQCLPVKLEPKNRFEKKNSNIRVITPIIEDDSEIIITNDMNSDEIPFGPFMPPGAIISNNSFVVNFNLNLDGKAVDKAVEKSKKVVKGIAAAGAAVLGTALLFASTSKKIPDKIKIPLMPKIKIPNPKKKK